MSDASVVLKIDMTLTLPEGGTTDDAAEAIASALSAVHGMPAGHIEVGMNAVPVASRRRLLQASAAQYAADVRISFPAGTSAADVAAMQSRLGAMDASQLNEALQNAPGGMRFSVNSISVAPGLTAAAPVATPVPIAPTTTPAAAAVQAASLDIMVIIGCACAGVVVVVAAVLCIACRSHGDKQIELKATV
jgi:hypothetical protein